MKGRLLLCCLLLTTPLAAAREGLALQELRIDVDQMSHKAHSHQIEIDILHEKFQSLDKGIQSLKKELSGRTSDDRTEKRLRALEKNHETVLSDLKTLKEKLNDSSSKIASLDKQLSQDIKSLKSSLHSMVALLKGEETKTYTVKDGDSLGKIALQNHTSSSRLKELNQLSSDRIYTGQKLTLPQ